MPSPSGQHHKAPWEGYAGQADNLRWLARVRFLAQVKTLQAEAEELYLKADAIRGERCPRAYPIEGVNDADDVV